MRQWICCLAAARGQRAGEAARGWTQLRRQHSHKSSQPTTSTGAAGLSQTPHPLSGSASHPGSAGVLDSSLTDRTSWCRSRTDIELAYIRQWKRTTARDGQVKPQTLWSTLWFLPVWLKYQVVPEIMRYAWFIVWSALRRVYFRFHTWAVLQGAHAAACLSHRQEPNCTMHACSE